MSVKRFKNTIRMSEDGPVDALVESDTGSWVLWSDYDALAAELAEQQKLHDVEDVLVRSRALAAEARVQALEAALAYLVNAHDVEPDRRGVLVDVPNALSKARQLLNERATSETKGEQNA